MRPLQLVVEHPLPVLLRRQSLLQLSEVTGTGFEAEVSDCTSPAELTCEALIAKLLSARLASYTSLFYSVQLIFSFHVQWPRNDQVSGMRRRHYTRSGRSRSY